MNQVASYILKAKNAFIPAIICAVIILVLSALPQSSFHAIDWYDIVNLDKFGHLVVYAIFTVLIAIGLFLRNNKKYILKAVFMAVGYGALMELLQYGCFTGRNFEILDLIANIIGSIIGSVICYFIIKK